MLCYKIELLLCWTLLNQSFMKIKHLRNSAIDYIRWDDCIAQSNNPLEYARTWYLDIVSPNWEALISEDYDFVMPLPTKSKYKIPYLVQPILTQQLGIFSKHEINDIIVQEFIKEIPYYSYELNLNELNFYPKALIYPNFLLDLNQSYTQIASVYSKNTQRNIEKATKLNLKVEFNLSATDFLNFYYSVEKRFLPVKQSVLKKLIEKGITKNSIALCGVYSANNELIAGVCLLISPHRITYLLPVSSAVGKVSSAMFILIDQLIQNEMGKNSILDFEGSRIEGIARFYKGFGAKNQPYYILKKFRPSFLINKL